MGRRATYRPGNVCKTCGYTFYPRGHNVSLRCPNCGSRDIRMSYAGCVLPIAVVLFLIYGQCRDKSGDGASKRSTTTRDAPAAWAPKLTDGKVTLKRTCDLWGYDDAGTALVVREAAAGETYAYVGHDDMSTELLDADTTRHLWIVNRCAK